MENEIKLIKRSNGYNYSIRKDRHRYFFPHEWKRFIDTFDDDKDAKTKLMFQLLLFTGGRIMEVINLQAKDFDFERGTISFKTTKQRKAKKNYYATGTSRTFFISSNCVKVVRTYINKNNLKPDNYLFLNEIKLPENYSSLTNDEKKKYYKGYKTNYHIILKKRLKKIGIEDWNNFSIHNIRKTYGNWMRIFEIDNMELCYRMGHDLNTFMTHYGSSLLFDQQERQLIGKIFGEVK